MQGQSMQRNAATKAEGLVHGAGINSMAQVASAGFKADSLVAQGQAQGQASMMSGITSGISGLAKGFGAMGSGGGAGASSFSMSDGRSFNPYSPSGNVSIPTGY